jgi:hypothetical protein
MNPSEIAVTRSVLAFPAPPTPLQCKYEIAPGLREYYSKNAITPHCISLLPNSIGDLDGDGGGLGGDDGGGVRWRQRWRWSMDEEKASPTAVGLWCCGGAGQRRRRLEKDLQRVEVADPVGGSSIATGGGGGDERRAARDLASMAGGGAPRVLLARRGENGWRATPDGSDQGWTRRQREQLHEQSRRQRHAMRVTRRLHGCHCSKEIRMRLSLLQREK